MDDILGYIIPLILPGLFVISWLMNSNPIKLPKRKSSSKPQPQPQSESTSDSDMTSG